MNNSIAQAATEPHAQDQSQRPTAGTTSTLNTEAAPTLAAVPGPDRTWVRQIVSGGQITETCPDWCTSTHANDANGCLDDLLHSTTEVSARLEMHVAGTDGPAAWPVLAATIQQHPYSDKPEWRAPHVSFEPSPDDYMDVLDADQFAAVIDQLAAHVDRLRAVHAQLVALTAETGEAQ